MPCSRRGTCRRAWAAHLIEALNRGPSIPSSSFRRRREGYRSPGTFLKHTYPLIFLFNSASAPLKRSVTTTHTPRLRPVCGPRRTGPARRVHASRRSAGRARPCQPLTRFLPQFRETAAEVGRETLATYSSGCQRHHHACEECQVVAGVHPVPDGREDERLDGRAQGGSFVAHPEDHKRHRAKRSARLDSVKPPRPFPARQGLGAPG